LFYYELLRRMCSVLNPLLDPGNVVDPDLDPVDPKLSGLLDPNPDLDPPYLSRFV
jgi:hypothetical protein